MVAGAGVREGHTGSRFHLESTPTFMGAELGHLPGSQQNQAHGSLAEGHGSRKTLGPCVFPSSPTWPQKPLGITGFSSHCSAPQPGKRPKSFCTQGKGNRLGIFIALKSLWAHWPRRAPAAEDSGPLRVGLWFPNCSLLPLRFPTTLPHRADSCTAEMPTWAMPAAHRRPQRPTSIINYAQSHLNTAHWEDLGPECRLSTRPHSLIVYYLSCLPLDFKFQESGNPPAFLPPCSNA